MQEDIPKKIEQRTAEQVVRESGIGNDRTSSNSGKVDSVPLLPEIPSSAPSVSFLELLYASFIRKLENEVIHPSSQGGSAMSTLFSVIKSLLLGKSPITSLIGLVGFIVTGIGEYILGSPSFSNLTLVGFIQYIGLRFAKDVSKQEEQ